MPIKGVQAIETPKIEGPEDKFNTMTRVLREALVEAFKTNNPPRNIEELASCIHLGMAGLSSICKQGGVDFKNIIETMQQEAQNDTIDGIEEASYFSTGGKIVSLLKQILNSLGIQKFSENDKRSSESPIDPKQLVSDYVSIVNRIGVTFGIQVMPILKDTIKDKDHDCQQSGEGGREPR